MNRLIASYAALAAGLALAGAAHAQGEEPASASLTPAVPVAEAQPAGAYAWGGAWVTNHYVGGYGGAMKALNHDDSLWENGFVLRADISGGRYSYSNPPGFIDEHVGVVDAEALLGYRNLTDVGTFSGYVGVDYINHDNSDPAARLRGSETGVALIGEYSNTYNKNTEVDLQGRYASPFSTWQASGRVLWKVTDAAWLGPQVSYYRNDGPYEEISVGPLLKVNTSFGEVGVTGGYRHPMTSGSSDGYYASVYFAVPLRP